jgi:hypothetical protein
MFKIVRKYFRYYILQPLFGMPSIDVVHHVGGVPVVQPSSLEELDNEITELRDTIKKTSDHMKKTGLWDRPI